jgi:hypothetical protein
MSKMRDDPLLQPVVGVGTPDFQEALSDGDQKKIDEKGAPIVLGLPWSEAGTGLYLSVYLVRVAPGVKLGADRPVLGRALGMPPCEDGVVRALGVFVSRGKPVWNLGGHGAALELPSDLGQDALKVKYVTEWFIDTVKEAVTADGMDPSSLNKLAGEMVLTVERAVHEAGL